MSAAGFSGLFGPRREGRKSLFDRRLGRILLPTLVGAAFLIALALALPEVMNSPRPLAEYGENVLYTAFGGRSPRTLDPQKSYSSDEAAYVYSICEPLYQYAYLERPYRLEARTAERVEPPRYVDAEGRTLPEDAPAEKVAETIYELQLREGIFYAPHPAFVKDETGAMRYAAIDGETAESMTSPLDLPQAATRELTAADYANGIRRIASPQVVSPVFSMMRRRIVGFDEYGRALEKRWSKMREQGASPSAYLDLWADPLPGVEALDRRRLRIRVKGKDPLFAYWLAMSFFAPMPVEAERFYAQESLRSRNLTLDTWPVGTGAFRMAVYEENRRHVLERNPRFRRALYPCRGEPGDAETGLLKDCGKPLPFLDRVVFEIEKEAVPLKAKFLSGYYDSPFIDRTDSGLGFLSAMADDPDQAEEFKEKGLRFPEAVEASLWYIGFNWLDPVVGGGENPEAARRSRLLRRAIAIAFDWEEELAIFQKNQGMPAHGPIPPGIFGWRESGPAAFNPFVYRRGTDGRAVRRPVEEAKRLLAEAGYPDGRDAKTGEPLILVFDYQQAAQGSKAYLEWYQRQFAKLGIQLEIRATDYNRFQEKMAKGSAQIFFWGWKADYPDPENFLFLFYGPNGKVRHGGENAGNYENPRFDALFRRFRTLPEGEEKARLIDEMIRILQEDGPILFGYYPPAAAAYQSWVGNAKPSAMVQNSLQYLKIDGALRLRKIREWNRPVVWPIFIFVLVGVGAAAGAARYVRGRTRRTAFDLREDA